MYIYLCKSFACIAETLYELSKYARILFLRKINWRYKLFIYYYFDCQLNWHVTWLHTQLTLPGEDAFFAAFCTFCVS